MCGSTWDYPDVVKDCRAGFILASSNRLFWWVESFFVTYAKPSASGGATDERPSYGLLANLLNTVGGILQPKACCAQVFAGQSG